MLYVVHENKKRAASGVKWQVGDGRLEMEMEEQEERNEVTTTKRHTEVKVMV